ncbi:MAG TPA: lytic murein transglycosylase, partial [Aestuariivirgaceae bacterium]|nr:lytic murein transglycosylase [Aestuariivirgaceae bacterium]
MQPNITAALLIAVLSAPLLDRPAYAECGHGKFSTWLEGVREEAQASGISGRALRALDDVQFDQGIIDRDRAQGVFSQSFLEFSGRMVNTNRMQVGASRLKKHKALFAEIERTYGVPGPVITAFWGLETDYGANTGDFSTLNALASLAYDCRRPDKFRPQLIYALRIIDRGDLGADELIGAWAGEIGQVQFQPEDYVESGVDFDGDGRIDLRRSVPDVLASSANLLSRGGWQAGEPWLEEVRVPRDLDWKEADLTIRHPRSQWAEWGVNAADGSPLEADAKEASLLLPMGRNGPAFLAYPNFSVYLDWNQSLVYATTAAYFATRLAGAPPVGKGNAKVASLGAKQVFELQRLLVKHGYDVGKVDGILGLATRN